MDETSPRRGRGTSAGLTRAIVVAAAERLVDERGVQGASLRAVAVELGVTPGAIYSYVSSRQELLDAVADAFLAREVLRRLPSSAPPIDLLRLLCIRLHAAGVAHPASLSAVVGHVPEQTGTAQMDIAERMLGALRSLGADHDLAQRSYRKLVAVCLGYAVHDANLASLDEAEAARRLDIHAASPTHPEVASYVGSLTKPTVTDWFTHELDRELDRLLVESHPLLSHESEARSSSSTLSTKGSDARS